MENAERYQKQTIGIQNAKYRTVGNLAIGIQNAKRRTIRKLTIGTQNWQLESKMQNAEQ